MLFFPIFSYFTPLSIEKRVIRAGVNGAGVKFRPAIKRPIRYIASTMLAVETVVSISLSSPHGFVAANIRGHYKKKDRK